jgi:hypothetical protein
LFDKRKWAAYIMLLAKGFGEQTKIAEPSVILHVIEHKATAG